MKKKKIIISDIDYLIGKNSEITDNTHMDLVDEISNYIEQLLSEPKANGVGAEEFMRVLDKDGVLIFKWNESQITLNKVLKVIGVEPLFGHTSGKSGMTIWMTFMKPHTSTNNQPTKLRCPECGNMRKKMIAINSDETIAMCIYCAHDWKL